MSAPGDEYLPHSTFYLHCDNFLVPWYCVSLNYYVWTGHFFDDVPLNCYYSDVHWNDCLGDDYDVGEAAPVVVAGM